MPQPQSPQEKRRAAAKAYAKYGGMAFQFLAACLVGVFIGKWLDAKMQLDRPLWAVFLTIGFMAAAFYSVYKQLLRD
ncbi:MAG: AtpZ/AtpI family protein [Saprospiraceae bacterium]